MFRVVDQATAEEDVEFFDIIFSDDETYSDTYMVGKLDKMCSIKERNERERGCLLSKYEIESISQSGRLKVQKTNANLIVASFKRHSTGDANDVDLNNLRSPSTLKMTMNYLLDEIIDLPNENYIEIYTFLSDRFRAIRQECIIQNCFTRAIIRIHEQMARFYIYSGYKLLNQANFNATLNDTELKNILLTLKNLYKWGNRDYQFLSLNQAEILSYDFLFHFNDVPYLIYSQVHFTDANLAKEPIKLILDLHNAFFSKNYYQFFQVFKKLNYLHSCLAYRFVHQVRIQATECMNISHKALGFPLKASFEILCFDSFEETLDFYKNCQLLLDEKSVKFTGKRLTIPTFPLPPASILVDSKKPRVTKFHKYICSHCPFARQELDQLVTLESGL